MCVVTIVLDYHVLCTHLIVPAREHVCVCVCVTQIGHLGLLCLSFQCQAILNANWKKLQSEL